jgi:hypothetical protein
MGVLVWSYFPIIVYAFDLFENNILIYKNHPALAGLP